jgi:hypothetical protein
VGQTTGRTGGKCEILGVYVSACCESLKPVALDAVFPSCSCGRQTSWFFLQHEIEPARQPSAGGVNGGGGIHR